MICSNELKSLVNTIPFEDKDKEEMLKKIKDYKIYEY